MMEKDKEGLESNIEKGQGVFIGRNETNQKPVLYDIFTHNNKNSYIVGDVGIGQKFIFNQSLEQLKDMYPISYRSNDHKYKTNNWLKNHGNPTRRRPFKKEILLLDEYSMIRGDLE